MASSLEDGNSIAIADQLIRLQRRVERSRLAVSDHEASAPLDRAAYFILGRLESEGPQRLSEVAHFFNLDVSTISRQVASLEAKALIERVADPRDGRAQLLQLTPSGSNKFLEVRDRKRAVITEQLADWSPDDRAQFARLLTRYNQVMDNRILLPEEAKQ